MAQGGGRGWFHRKRTQPQPVVDAPDTQSSQSGGVSETAEASGAGDLTASTFEIDANQADWSPEARRTVQLPASTSAPIAASPPAPSTAPSVSPAGPTPAAAPIRPAAASHPQSDHPGSVGRVPEDSSRADALQTGVQRNDIAPANPGMSPTPARSSDEGSVAGAPTGHASTPTQSYDWDAATAAALSDETDAPRSSNAERPSATSNADRLLEDIIREIVGDAAMDTATSLHPTRSKDEGDASAMPNSTAAVPGSGQSTDPATAIPAVADERAVEATHLMDAARAVDAAQAVDAIHPLDATDLPEVMDSADATDSPEVMHSADATDSPEVMHPAAPTNPSDDTHPADSIHPSDAGTAADRTNVDHPENAHEPTQSEPEVSIADGTDLAHASGSRDAIDPDDAALDSGSDSATTVAAPDRPNHTLPAPWPSEASIAATTTGQGIEVSRETLDRPSPPTVSRETESEHGGTPLADQLADETRRRVALDEAVLPLPPSTRVLTISNQKGGVGKTTTAVNLAAALARAGAHVLVIDLDPQGNASTALGVDHRSEEQSVYEVLVGDLPLTDVIRSSTEHERLDCVPATIHLAGAEIELVSLVAREQRLRRALDRHLAAMERPYDYVFIDCPPSLGLLTINAFVAAREVLIPIQCEYYALEGLSQLLSNIELIEKHLNPELRLSTILLTMYDSRTNLAQQVAQEVRDHFPSQTLATIIPRSVRVSEAPSYGQSVISYDFASSGSLSYREAAAEIARRSASNQKESTDGN